jgi:hypothetical protein
VGILFDVPRIGKTNQWGQKGPTCWYYAAKMLLKFHEKIDKPENAEENKVYTEFKFLHELRKELCNQDDSAVRGSADKMTQNMKAEKTYLTRKVDEVANKMFAVEGGGGKYGVYYQHLNNIKEYLEKQLGDRVPRLEKAIAILEQMENRDLDRLALLTSYVPDAGFRQVPGSYKDIFASPESLEEVLRARGPLYSGGELTKLTSTNSTVAADSGDLIVLVGELKAKSAHAVVTLGVDGETVFYKDPNYTDKIFSVPFKTYAPMIDENPIYLECADCKHVEQKTMKVPTTS